MIEELKYELPEVKGELNEDDFKKLGASDYDLSGEKDKGKELLIEAHRNLMDVLRKYCDLQEEYYNIIALWIIGTYFHQNFPTYPYLFFNAMKGSGKSRTQRLTVFCSKDGSVLNSLTEAVLFRTKGTLGIDEFEGISRKGNEALKELLNSAYKKGIMVKRMKKKKTIEGEEQVVEEFDVYRPICLANIGGIDSVLSDRCITIILDKSGKKYITDLIEIFEHEQIIIHTKNILYLLSTDPSLCRLCNVVTTGNVYNDWNNYILSQKEDYTNNNNYNNNTNNNNYIIYKKMKDAGITGRDLELVFPFFIIAQEVGNLDLTIKQLQEIMEEKKQEDVIETTDISLIDFVSQEVDFNRFLQIQEVTRRFREFLQTNEEWMNDKWMGRALKRLNLIKEKRRMARGREVILNISKAQEKMKMFK